jgi:hypothetical protein
MCLKKIAAGARGVRFGKDNERPRGWIRIICGRDSATRWCNHLRHRQGGCTFGRRGMTVTEFRRAARTQRLSIYFQLVTRNAEHAFRLLFPPFLNILNDVPFSAEFPEEPNSKKGRTKIPFCPIRQYGHHSISSIIHMKGRK